MGMVLSPRCLVFCTKPDLAQCLLNALYQGYQGFSIDKMAHLTELDAAI